MSSNAGGAGGDRSNRWTVVNSNSFASVNVILPPQSQIDTETDAVVCMSGSIDVQGKLTGGIFGALGRMFLTQESFFTTRVTNTSLESSGDVLLAPSTTGGIILHKLLRGHDLLLTKGSYLASDCSVQVTTEIQRGSIGNSLWSGTGFFLLRAHAPDPTSENMVAIAGYGSIHEYTLGRGERRFVDNGHLLAWTASMTYTTSFASSTVWGSISSGEGLMCEFIGPGTLYLQSHKPENEDFGIESGGRRGRSSGSNPQRGSVGTLFGCSCFMIFIVILVAMIVWLSSIAGTISWNLDTNAYYDYSASPTGHYEYRRPRPTYTREL